MTENLAGRGEGLKGLVAQHDPQLYSPQGPVSGVNGTYTIAFHGCSCGWNSDGEASKTEKWSEHVIAALEAAARLPAPDPRTILSEAIIDALAAMPMEANMETVWTCVSVARQIKRAAALATPSPQAPAEQCKVFSTTSAREQSAATASSNLSAGDEVWIKSRVIAKHEVRGVLIRVDGVGEPIMLQTWVPAEHFDKLRAVTQEQPAGSEATLDRERSEGLYLKFSEPLMEPHTPVIIERVNGDCTVSQFIVARDEAHELVNQLREFLAGSPRKVGEDGAEQLMTATGPVSLADFSRNLADDIYAISDGAAPDRETLRAMIRARLEVGLKYWKWERLAARSSSVPVGEQKQEDGV